MPATVPYDFHDVQTQGPPPYWTPWIGDDFDAILAWLGYAQPFINPMQPPFNAQGGNTDDADALNAAFNYAAQNNLAIFLPEIFKSSKAITVNQQGNVICAGYGPQSGILFTSAGSDAGFDLTLRAYNAGDGTIDRVFFENFFLYAGAVHTSPAIKAIYAAHTPNANTSIVLRNVQVVCEEGVFGVKQFARGLHISSCYNFFVDTFTFVGSTTLDATGVYINNSINGRFKDLDVSWCFNPVHITTGDAGPAEPQCEGIYFTNSVLYANVGPFLIDGNSTGAQNAIDILCNGGAIQPAGAATVGVEWTLVAQSRLLNVDFYTAPGYPSDAINFISCFGVTVAFCDVLSVDITPGIGTSGIKLTASSGANIFTGNWIAGFDTGLSMDGTCVSNTFGQNSFVDNTIPIANTRSENVDFGNVVLGAGGVFVGVTSAPAPLTPYDFGAVCDGVTDDAVALQSWLDAGSASRPLAFPAATCATSVGLTLASTDGLTIIGSSPFDSVILYTGVSTTTDFLNIGSTSGSVSKNIAIENLRFRSSTTMTDGFALRIQKSLSVLIKDVVVDGVPGTSNGKIWGGIWGEQSEDVIVSGGQITGRGDLIRVNGGTVASGNPRAEFSINSTRLIGTNSTATGIHIAGGFGGFACVGYTSISTCLHNMEIDTTITAEGNREIYVSPNCIFDICTGDSVVVDDSGPVTGGGGNINLFGHISASGGHGVNVKNWAAGWITFGPGPITTSTGDNVRLSDATGNYVFLGGRNSQAGGWGINATVPIAQVYLRPGPVFAANTSGDISANASGFSQVPAFTVANLPTVSIASLAYATDGRKNGEGPGAGTGVLVFGDATAWRACDTGATVAA